MSCLDIKTIEYKLTSELSYYLQYVLKCHVQKIFVKYLCQHACCDLRSCTLNPLTCGQISAMQINKVWMTDFKANPSWIVPLRKHKSLYAEMHMFVFKQSKIYSIKGKSWEKLWGFFVPLKKKLPLRPLWLKAQITNTAMGMSKSLLLINTTFYYSNIETLKPNKPAVFCQT